MSNKRYQLLVQWNNNYVEAMPQVKDSWIELVKHAKKIRQRFSYIHVSFLEWDDNKPESLTLGKFTEKVLEEEDEIQTLNNMD